MFVGCAPAILRPSGLLSALRPQDVFATSLYSGASGAGQQLLTVGFDPDLFWDKSRNAADSHYLQNRLSPTKLLSTNTTGAESEFGNYFGPKGSYNLIGAGQSAVKWSFRRAPKFFDIVTYTGDGTSGRVIPHGLGIKPGFMVVKSRTQTNSWYAWHRASNSGNSVLILNNTQAAGSDDGQIWGNDATGTHVEPSATGFTISSNPNINGSGNTYVAYLFAHDPDTTNGIVQCGSAVADANGAVSINLGYAPQWALFRSATSTSDWVMVDTARGWASTASPFLAANLSNAEGSRNTQATVNGFVVNFVNWASQTIIYVVIRAPIT